LVPRGACEGLPALGSEPVLLRHWTSPPNVSMLSVARGRPWRWRTG
jgi:hypothetical protein